MNDLSDTTLEEPRFEDGRPMLIAGLNERYTQETRMNIPRQWEKFAPMIGSVPGQIGGTSYGVCWNFREGCNFDYLSGVEVAGLDGLPKDFTHVEIPAQRYAVFTHRDHVSKIPQTIQAIWTQWVKESGETVGAGPSFERYTEEFDPRTGMGGIEIWVPVKG